MKKHTWILGGVFVAPFNFGSFHIWLNAFVLKCNAYNLIKLTHAMQVSVLFSALFSSLKGLSLCVRVLDFVSQSYLEEKMFSPPFFSSSQIEMLDMK